MKIKYLFISVIISLFLTSLVSAEESRKGSGEFDRTEMAQRRVEKMQEHLNLSDEQADKIYNIITTKQSQGACRSLTNFSDKKKCRMANREALKSEIDSVLNPEQKKKAKEMHEGRKKHSRMKRDRD